MIPNHSATPQHGCWYDRHHVFQNRCGICRNVVYVKPECDMCMSCLSKHMRRIDEAWEGLKNSVDFDTRDVIVPSVICHPLVDEMLAHIKTCKTQMATQRQAEPPTYEEAQKNDIVHKSYEMMKEAHYQQGLRSIGLSDNRGWTWEDRTTNRVEAMSRPPEPEPEVPPVLPKSAEDT